MAKIQVKRTGRTFGVFVDGELHEGFFSRHFAVLAAEKLIQEQKAKPVSHASARSMRLQRRPEPATHERFILSDGTLFITPNGNWTRDAMMAWCFYREEDAQNELQKLRQTFGTSLKINRLNLNTGTVR